MRPVVNSATPEGGPRAQRVTVLPYQRQAEIVLAKWREVERALALVERGSEEEEELEAEAHGLRDEYARLIDAARQGKRPVPPPFPDEARREGGGR